MSKQIPLGILLANWIVGLFFVLLTPLSTDTVSSVDGKSYLQTSQGLISEIGDLAEKPLFDLDLKAALPSSGFKDLLVHSKPAAASMLYSAYSTVPFFDVKQTFIHFFFTW